MTIHEPTGWELSCDNWRARCKRTFLPEEQPSDEAELLADAQGCGWLTSVSTWHHFCSLDCLLAARESKYTREEMARDASGHVERHETYCCRMHGTHRQPTKGDRWHSRGCRQQHRLIDEATQ